MSGAVDDDVMQTVASGRAALGDVLSAAQTHLQKVFLVFVAGLMLTIYGLRAFVWNELRADLFSRLPPDAAERTIVVATTPFDVILLQVKIGLVVGVLLSLPVLIFYSRDGLRRRGLWPTDRVPRWQLAVIGLFSLLLFLGGVAYAYFLFFPLMFKFLAVNAIQSGFEPTYSIVKWAQFVFLLGLSFGLAAQLPLLMTGLSYTGIVPYETFRDRWKVAILVMFVFGALFSPPDPFTQIMWALPLVLLYGFSLAVSKVVVNVKRSRETFGLGSVVVERWNVIAGTALVGGVVAYVLLTAAASGRLDPYLAWLPAAYRPALGSPNPVFGLSVPVAAALSALAVAVADAFVAFLYYLNKTIDELAAETGPAPASAGAPGDIDVRNLDAAGVRAAPAEAFADMTEDEALSIASRAIDDGDHEKAQAVLDRFDEVQAATSAEAPTAADEAAVTADHPDDVDPEIPADVEAAATEEETGSVFTRTGAGMLSAFTEDEKDEDDVGGYLYDIAFILDSVTSKAIWIVGIFMVVMASVFGFLYTGGIKYLMEVFLGRLPEGVIAEEVDIVALHPVEALIFEIKLATVIGLLATLPVFLYFAWPSLKERGFAQGDRNVLMVWAVALFVGTIAGAVFGFIFVAPSIISYLAADVARANMVIAYRINNFGWLVFFTTIGVGLLADIPISMFLFHRGGLVSYATMRRRWREVTLGVLGVVAMLSPRGVFMMFLIGIPVMLSYVMGLAVLWLYTLGGRRAPGGGNGGQRSESDEVPIANAQVLIAALAVLVVFAGATAAAAGLGPLDPVSLDDIIGGEADGSGVPGASTATPIVTPSDDETATASPPSSGRVGSAANGPTNPVSLADVGFSDPRTAAARETPPGTAIGPGTILTPTPTIDGDVDVTAGSEQVALTPTDSSTSTDTPTPTNTATPTSSATETSTDTLNAMSTPTDTATPTDTLAHSPTSTEPSTPTGTTTGTPSPTSTTTPTPSPTPTPTPAPTPTATQTPSNPLDDPLDDPLGGLLFLSWDGRSV